MQIWKHNKLKAISAENISKKHPEINSGLRNKFFIWKYKAIFLKSQDPKDHLNWKVIKQSAIFLNSLDMQHYREKITYFHSKLIFLLTSSHRPQLIQNTMEPEIDEGQGRKQKRKRKK